MNPPPISLGLEHVRAHAYADFLNRIHGSSRTFDDFFDAGCKSVVLRHDINFSLSSAFTTARLEQEMNIKSPLEKLVHAVAKPFHGAFAYAGESKVTIDRAAIFYQDLESHPFKIVPFGTVCDVFQSGKFLVRCSGGVMMVHEYQSEIAMIPGLEFVIASSLNKRYFKRNINESFDLESK